MNNFAPTCIEAIKFKSLKYKHIVISGFMMAAKRITHWRKVLKPASGGAAYDEKSIKAIRFVRMGCANRPFYHIVVAEVKMNFKIGQ